MECNDSPSVLSLKNISISLEDKTILDDVSLELCAGERLALIGENGAGKSTLLKTIAGDLVPTTGEILFDGINVNFLDMQDRAKAIGVLPQFSLLNFPYTVREVVSLGRTPHSTGKHIDNEIVDSALDAMDLTSFSERVYTQLSGGEKQRTQLARVLAQIWREEDTPTRLLLLDEPTTALDLGHQQLLMEKIGHIANDKVAVVMVVHDINIALASSDRIVALSEGKVVASGDAQTVVDEKLVKRLFNADVGIVNHESGGKRVVMI